MAQQPALPGSGDPLDNVLRTAFPLRDRSSVMERLAARTASTLGVHLPAATGEDRPLVLAADRSDTTALSSARYQVLGEIARGGVGVVYHALDVDLGRDVAMKVLRAEYLERTDVVQRFVEEAQIGGQLQHPGIVPVYELGLQDGERPFFAMKLVQGRTLAALLNARTDATEDRQRLLRSFEQVCLTIAYAHARSVVHRDLKPANVMIGSFGEVQVADWGFAKVLSSGGIEDERRAPTRHQPAEQVATIRTREGSKPTLTGSVFGTPEYMPPEQARGEVERMDERADVFSLGAILCEILTGAPPYIPADGDVLVQARQGETRHALERLERCSADRELIELARRCLSTSAQDRPATARQVAEAIGRHLSSLEQRARAADVRARATIGITLTVLIALGAGVAGYLYLRGKAESRRQQVGALVTAALQETRELEGRANAVGAGADAWVEALRAAEKAASLADAPDVPSELRQDSQSLLEAVRTDAARAARARETAERDAAMVARLLELRVPDDTILTRAGWELEEAQRLVQAFAAAFRAYGADVDALEPDALAARLRGPIASQLASALDFWGLQRRAVAPSDPAPTLRLHALAAAIDTDDDWRHELRGLLAQGDLDPSSLKQLATTAQFDALPVLSLTLLGEALWSAGERAESLHVFRRAREVYPEDFVLALRLCLLLTHSDPNASGGGLVEERKALLRVAQALRPDMREVRHCLAAELFAAGELEEAARLFESLAQDEPNARRLRFLGLAHEGRADYVSAARELRAALDQDPNDQLAREALARVLVNLGEYDEGLALLRSLLVLQPKAPKLHFHAARALHLLGLERLLGRRVRHDEVFKRVLPGLLDEPLVQESLAHYRRALDLNPAERDASYNIGNALQDAGEYAAAIDAFRAELAHDPEHVGAANNLCWSLDHAGRREEALAVAQRATDQHPDRAGFWVNLGNSLAQLRRHREAAEALARATRLAPDDPLTLTNLGLFHATQAQWAEALTYYERAAALAPEFPYVQQVLAEARSKVSLVAPWWDIVEGRTSLEDAQPQDAIMAARVAYASHRYLRSLELYESVLGAEPELDARIDPGALYDAACSAVLVVAGQGEETLPDEESWHARLRQLALAWLQQRLDYWEAHPDKAEVERALQHWLVDSDLATVRDVGALGSLPGTEASGWLGLWTRVAATLDEARHGR